MPCLIDFPECYEQPPSLDLCCYWPAVHRQPLFLPPRPLMYLLPILSRQRQHSHLNPTMWVHLSRNRLARPRLKRLLRQLYLQRKRL